MDEYQFETLVSKLETIDASINKFIDLFMSEQGWSKAE
jgi:hypothetical protein